MIFYGGFTELACKRYSPFLGETRAKIKKEARRVKMIVKGVVGATKGLDEEVEQ